jgi:hypothetical protein
MIDTMLVALGVVVVVVGLSWPLLLCLQLRGPRPDEAADAGAERARRQAFRAVQVVRVPRRGARLTATGYVPLVWLVLNEWDEVIDRVCLGFGQLDLGEMPLAGSFDRESWIRQRAALRRVLARMTC